MNAPLERAAQLIKLKKFPHAVKELDMYLAAEPGDAVAHAYKAIAFDSLNQPRRALDSATKAVSLAPDYHYVHYILGIIHFDQTKNYLEAEDALKEALRLAPDDPDYFEVYAKIKIARGRYSEALEICNQGLKLAPEHTDLKSTRARAYALAGKSKDSDRDILEALRSDPGNLESMISDGWVKLISNENSQALDIFTEALKKEPGNESARFGLIESLKAQNFFFRMYLRYAYWIGRQSLRVKLGLIAGVSVLLYLMRQFPAMTPVVFVYGFFVVSTWVINPVFNFFLIFHKSGKYALTKHEIVTSYLVVACLFLAMIHIILFFIVDKSYVMGIIALVFLVVPINGRETIRTIRNDRYRIMNIILIVLCVITVSGIALLPLNATAGIFFCVLSLLGSIASSWLVLLFRR